MSKINFDSQNVVNEWNMVAGYYDILYRLIRYYNEATLTPGGNDDLEAIKRVIDHSSCKIRFYEKKLKAQGCKSLEWFKEEIERIEGLFTMAQMNNKGGRSINFKLAENITTAKRDIRDLHREIMWCFQCMGDFDKSRMLRGKKLAFSQFGGMEDEE